MTFVDENRLKGNYAENVVAAWLSRVCLVRPVAEGTDIGIDLYCESLVGGAPYLHFWAQVKAIPLSNVATTEKEEAWFDFKTKHLHYWANQPIPVYAFLVPIDEWPPKFPERIYGVRITEHIIRNGVPNVEDQKQVRIKSSGWMDANTIDTDLTQFITEIVPWDTSILLLQKGIIVPINESHSSQERRFPVGIGFKYLEKVLENIRDAAVNCIRDALALEYFDPSKKVLRKRFEAVAQIFEDEMHLLGVSMLVRAAHADNDVERAKHYIFRAMARVRQDKTLGDDEKNRYIGKLRMLLAEFE